jgi:hypothetical protein
MQATKTASDQFFIIQKKLEQVICDEAQACNDIALITQVLVSVIIKFYACAYANGDYKQGRRELCRALQNFEWHEVNMN